MESIVRLATRALQVVRRREFAASVLAVGSAGVMAFTSLTAQSITGLSSDKVVLSVRNDPYVVQSDIAYPMWNPPASFDVSVTADGETTVLRMVAGRVADALEAVGITVGADDMLSVSPDDALVPDMAIEVRRITYRESTETQSIPFETITLQDNTMKKGTSKVTVEGQEGQKELTYREMLVDGQVMGRQLVGETTVKSPVSKRVVKGTYIEPYKAASGGYTEDDLYCLAVAIYREAGSDYLTDEHRAMVGCVVMNRVKSKLFPNSIRGVLTQHGQYQGMWTNGVHFPAGVSDSSHAVKRAYRVAREVLEGKWDCPDNVVFQANFPQGSGIYRTIYGGGTVTYFCYR